MDINDTSYKAESPKRSIGVEDVVEMCFGYVNIIRIVYMDVCGICGFIIDKI
jgi:hypothetical protein